MTGCDRSGTEREGLTGINSLRHPLEHSTCHPLILPLDSPSTYQWFTVSRASSPSLCTALPSLHSHSLNSTPNRYGLATVHDQPPPPFSLGKRSHLLHSPPPSPPLKKFKLGVTGLENRVEGVGKMSSDEEYFDYEDEGFDDPMAGSGMSILLCSPHAAASFTGVLRKSRTALDLCCDWLQSHQDPDVAVKCVSS